MPCVAAKRPELPTSIVNHCVLSIVIATLSQHLKDLIKKHLPDFKGGSLGFRQHAMILGILALFSSKIAIFVVLAGLEPATSPM